MTPQFIFQKLDLYLANLQTTQPNYTDVQHKLEATAVDLDRYAKEQQVPSNSMENLVRICEIHSILLLLLDAFILSESFPLQPYHIAYGSPRHS